MAQIVKKLLVYCLIATVIFFAGNAARAEQATPEKLLQPEGLNHAGIYTLRQIDPSLTGAGVKIAVICRSSTYIGGEPQNDYRPNVGHNCFRAAKFGFHNQAELPAGISPHSTAICSILLGEDPAAYNPQVGQFYYQGAAPQAKAEVYEFWHFLTNNVLTCSPPDVDIITASFGNESEEWWTRGIEALAEHNGLIIVAGIGNGLNATDPVLYPGAAANTIGVGVVSAVDNENLAVTLANFALAYPKHSSFGPTGDGRCKPDIVAPGNFLAANTSQADRYDATGDWSSFSTPAVAGAVALLVQKAKQDQALSAAISPEGGNCVIKAILLNSARKLPFWHKGHLSLEDNHSVPLDYIQGAGMLDAVNAYKQLVAGQNKPGNAPNIGWDLNRLDKNQNPANSYKITLTEPADKLITITLVWNKHYSKTYPFQAMAEKDANLRIELWAVDLDDPNNDYLLDYSDSSADNVEHIYTAIDANYTNYEMVVSYSENQNPENPLEPQRYGLAWGVSDKKEDNSIFWYDLNADGIVDDSDIAILLFNFFSSAKSPEAYLLGDINANGAIDANDLQILTDHINTRADWHTESQPK